MKQAIICLVLLLTSCICLISCDKKKKKEEVAIIPTDSVYFYAVVDSLTFTSSNTKALYFNTNNPYLTITGQTGPDSNDKTISLRIDNFLNQAGVYPISNLSDAKASYSKNNKSSETADSGRIVIYSIGKSIRGSFSFYTEHHMISSGTFSAQ